MSVDLSSAFASMGSAGHHIYSHGHVAGKITEHGHVYDKAGHKVGSIDHDGTLWDRAHHRIGRIGENGHAYTKYSSHAQVMTHGDNILDASGKHIGRSSGGSLGGAAMLLMLNK